MTIATAVYFMDVSNMDQQAKTVMVDLFALLRKTNVISGNSYEFYALIRPELQSKWYVSNTVRVTIYDDCMPMVDVVSTGIDAIMRSVSEYGEHSPWCPWGCDSFVMIPNNLKINDVAMQSEIIMGSELVPTMIQYGFITTHNTKIGGE